MKKIMMLSTLLLLLFPCNVQAANVSFPTIESENFIDVVSPCADIIETKYRISSGKVQYRRWNTSKLCWVDSNWRDL